MPKVDLSAIKDRVSRTFDGFTRGQKTMLAIAVAAVLVGGFLFTKWSSAPSYTALFSNLSAKDASEVTTQLTSKGVAYKLADGGATVMVPRAEVYQMRLDLSSQGLPSTGQPGYSLLDKQGITTSEFRQRVDYQRALEGELANTVGAIKGVSGATVHLVIPKDDLFSKDSSKPTASVLVQQSSGATLTAGQVQAIVHLVASSVEGLDPADVTVADGNGRVLSAPGEDGLAAGDARTEQTTGFENQLSGSIEELLVPLVGEGHAVVKVKAALDFDKRQTTSETFGNAKGVALAVNEATSKETYTGTGTNGATGVLGPTGGPTTGTGQGDYNKETAERGFAVDKVTEQVQTAPGKVSRLTVAVLLDAGTKNVDRTAITNLVSAAAGLDANRGDTIEVSALKFDTSAADAAKQALQGQQATERQSQLFAMLRTLGSLLIVALVLLFAFRSARKATGYQRVPMALPVGTIDVDSIEDPSAEFLDGAAELLPPEPVALAPAKELVPSNLVDLIDSQPEDVAQMLRGWLSDRRT
ncbi:MAG: flagellar M-ring protein FliF [Acidimicrobiales bacterium]|nr:flagellar M-ring protein FliF [Acidimicrobiales bacterium]